MKTLAAAVLLAATTGVANAAIVEGTGVDGELFLSVFDPSGEVSYHMDLGITLSQFNADDSSFRSFDLAADASYAQFLGQTDLRYSVVAQNNIVPVVIETFDTFGVMVTSTNGQAGVEAKFPNQGAAEFMFSRINTQANLLNVRTGVPYSGTNGGDNGSAMALIGQQGYFDIPNWGDVSGNPGLTTSTNVGDAIAFYQINVSTEDFETGLVTQMGDWLLSTEGALTYGAPVSAVPVPAAVWLFGSGLIGLVGVARRKQA